MLSLGPGSVGLTIGIRFRTSLEIPSGGSIVVIVDSAWQLHSFSYCEVIGLYGQNLSCAILG